MPQEGQIEPQLSSSSDQGRGPVGMMAVFEVGIGPGGIPGKLRVEVITSPAGHPSATAGLDAGSLTARRRLLQQEVLASSALTRGVPETEQLLRETGQDLFAALL